MPVCIAINRLIICAPSAFVRMRAFACNIFVGIVGMFVWILFRIVEFQRYSFSVCVLCVNFL